MGMYTTCSTAEESLCLDTKWLKNHGYFCGYKSGGLSWTRSWGGDDSSIGISVDTMDDSPHIRLQYSTGGWDDERRDMNYSIPLIKVPCNLGGFRWAFRCELWLNGSYCGKTAYNIYKAGSDYFGCRNCMRIVYESQRKSGSRFECLTRALDARKKVEDLRVLIHKWTYKGKLTKKAKKYRELLLQMPLLDKRATEQTDLLLNKWKR